jgi:hypothetical protein
MEKPEELRIGRDSLIARGPRGIEIAREIERRRQWMRLAREGLAAAVLVALVGLGFDAVVVTSAVAAFTRMAAAW